MTTKQIRQAAKLSQTAAAAMAQVAPFTWRVYETDPMAIGEEKRRACDVAKAKMLELAKSRSAA